VLKTTQKQILEGVNVTEVGVIAKRFSVSKKEIAEVLGVSPRTLNKKGADKTHKLDKNLSERCINLKYLFLVLIILVLKRVLYRGFTLKTGD
jgi:hypothetical protein